MASPALMRDVRDAIACLPPDVGSMRREYVNRLADETNETVFLDLPRLLGREDERFVIQVHLPNGSFRSGEVRNVQFGDSSVSFMDGRDLVVLPRERVTQLRFAGIDLPNAH